MAISGMVGSPPVTGVLAVASAEGNGAAVDLRGYAVMPVMACSP